MWPCTTWTLMCQWWSSSRGGTWRKTVKLEVEVTGLAWRKFLANFMNSLNTHIAYENTGWIFDIEDDRINLQCDWITLAFCPRIWWILPPKDLSPPPQPRLDFLGWTSAIAKFYFNLHFMLKLSIDVSISLLLSWTEHLDVYLQSICISNWTCNSGNITFAWGFSFH